MGVEILIPIFGMIFSLGLPLAAVIVYIVLEYRKRRRLLELHHTERMAAIERGMELPAFPVELLTSPRKRRRSTSLLPGLVWFFIGVAILIAVQSLTDKGALLGLVPAGVGLAYLIYYFAEGRKIEARVLERELETKSHEAKA